MVQYSRVQVLTLSSPLYFCLAHTYKGWTSLERIKRRIYCFIWKCNSFILSGCTTEGAELSNQESICTLWKKLPDSFPYLFLIFVLSFFLSHFNFSFFKDYNKNHQRSHLPFFLSFIVFFFFFFFQFSSQPAVMTAELRVGLLSLNFWCGKPQITLSVLSFLLYFFISLGFFFQFSSQPTVMTAELMVGLLSLLFSFDVASYKLHNLFFLSSFLSFLFLKSACSDNCWLDIWYVFFSFLFRCSKLQITSFVLSFLLFHLIFLFL